MDEKKPQFDITWENWKITINKQTFNACWVKKQLIMRDFWAKKWGNELFGGVLNEGPRTAADDGALTTDYQPYNLDTEPWGHRVAMLVAPPCHGVTILSIVWR